MTDFDLVPAFALSFFFEAAFVSVFGFSVRVFPGAEQARTAKRIGIKRNRFRFMVETPCEIAVKLFNFFYF
jgi:hypothetical protein